MNAGPRASCALLPMQRLDTAIGAKQDCYSPDARSTQGFELVMEACAEMPWVHMPAGKLWGVISAEIGGGNGLQALLLGARLSLPVVDADLMGRAFPELQACTAFFSFAAQACLNQGLSTTARSMLPQLAESERVWQSRTLRARSIRCGQQLRTFLTALHS